MTVGTNAQTTQTIETVEGIVVPAARRATWNQVGAPVSAGADIKTALVEAGLDYKVIKCQDYMRFEGRYVKNSGEYWTVRKDTGTKYSKVTAAYEIVQNMDAFDFLSYFDGELTIERAGETADGMVFVIGSLPPVKILGDEFTPYLIFINGFGNHSLKTCICSLRIVCENQIPLAFKDSNSKQIMMHTKNVRSKIQKAGVLQKDGYVCMRELAVEAEKYAAVKIGPRHISQMVDALVTTKGTSERSITLLQKKRGEFYDRFADCYNADDNQNFRGSAWGVINALSDLYTRNPGSKNPEMAFKYATFTSDNKLLNAINILNDIIR